MANEHESVCRHVRGRRSGGTHVRGLSAFRDMQRECQDDGTAVLKTVGERGVVRRRFGVDQIQSDDARPAGRYRLDEFGLYGSSPWPPAVLLQAFLVDDDKHAFRARVACAANLKLRVHGRRLERIDDVDWQTES